MTNITKIFGSMVFNDEVMKTRLPSDIYKSLRNTILNGTNLDINVANIVASAMKNWAIEKGATHFTHWFQPMTGITAEKHDSFISSTNEGTAIMRFSGKELIKGEPDASSFPSGGLRATFEARGYTSWDPTSFAFVKDNTLYIPTAFCSYGGEALDKKTPLLRSMEALNTACLRILKLFGNSNISRVLSTVGPEQEYFLVDKELYNKRKDLILCGRTLLGAMPPKGQELDDHYFGTLKPRVASYMKELDEELWKLGIFAKTEHNEVAPAQHELAPIFTSTNVSTDHNQLVMDLMKKVANKHNLVCLLHEKPFDGINGSGKHNNWSISTNTGVNLLDPGDSPIENTRFLLFLSAIIKAVDEYQDLLRISVASAGNDHRLGANEAPPAIISIFLGDDLAEIIESLENNKTYIKKSTSKIEIGVDVLPNLKKDTTDRNRTSPFAFTGNKFEFRMLGSNLSLSDPNVVLNTIVSEALSEFADILENATDFNETLMSLIKSTIKDHKRILFNGNNYSDAWVKEAESRGLLNLKTTVDALPYLIKDKNVKLFEKHNVFTKSEIYSRYEIHLENYCKVINIEALTMSEIIKKDVIPSVTAYINDLSNTGLSKKALNPNANCYVETSLVSKLSDLLLDVYNKTLELDDKLSKVNENADILSNAIYYKDTIISEMEALRHTYDELEPLIGRKYLPYPTYEDLLFSI